jgi:hypothetical protein
MYATKVSDPELVFLLWEEIIVQNDRLFACYIAVAILDHEQGSLFDLKSAPIPVTLNRFKITEEVQMREIIEKSRNFKKMIPISVSTKLKQYDVFDLNKIESYVEVLKESTCLSILPREIMQLVYPEYKICPCQVKCESCDISYPVIIIDCRSSEMQLKGHFPNTEFLQEKHYNTLEAFPAFFENIKGIYHFALMDLDKNSSLVMNIAKTFIEQEFPYVSIIEGGYSSCHQLAMLFKLPINNHVPHKCIICKEQNKIKSNKEVKEEAYSLNNIQADQAKVYECHTFENGKALKTEKIDFMLTNLEIILYNSSNGFNQTFSLKDLNKLSTSKESERTLVFHFAGSRKKFEFSSKSIARKCLKEVSEAVRNLISN